MNVPRLQFEKIETGYAGTRILHGISGQVEAGKALGIFGRNGVGKTTFARALSGEIALSAGRLLFEGTEIHSHPTHLRRRRGLGYMPQTAMVFDTLTVRENLSLAGKTGSFDTYFDIFPRLAERLDQLAGSMSGGERKILAFVRTMCEDTNMIVLDEPSEGVQPENIAHMQACIEAKLKAGSAVILIEQNISMLMEVTDSYLGFDSGRVVFNGHGSSRRELLSVLEI